MTRSIFCSVCILVGAASFARAEEPVFSFSKEVTASSKSDESLVAVTLDADVFAATQDGFADLKLLDDGGTAVPFVLRKSREVQDQTVRRKTWTISRPSVRPLETGGLEITLTLDKDDSQPNGLSLVTPLRNFEQRIRVFTSEDGEQWDPAGAETLIFDYSQYMDVRSDTVPLPRTTRRHFRIVIDDVTAEQQSELLELTRRLRGSEETERTERIIIDRRPFRIDRIDFCGLKTEQSIGDKKRAYPVGAFDVSIDSKAQQTIITVDTRREPLTSLTLETSARNFSRHCAVQVEEKHGVQQTWRQIGDATISRIDFKTFKREELRIEIPESREKQYRLVIDNRDSPPLEVTGIQAEGNVYELVFLSATNKPHRLAYGAPDAAPPKYDTATIETLLGERYQPEQVSLGTEQKAAGAARPFKLSQWLNDPRILVGVIGLLVLVLGWGLYHAARRMDNLPPSSSE